MKTRIAIVGAGPAGLTAALELLSRSGDYEVVVLEESAEMGGISRTVRCPVPTNIADPQGRAFNRMDIGGHRFFSKDTAVMQWWQQRMPLQGSPSYDDLRLHREVKVQEGGPDPEKSDRVMLVRRRVSRIYYNKKFFDYPISLKLQTLKNMGIATTFKAGGSYLKAAVRKRPETSLESFYINRFGRVLYSMFFEGYTEKLWGRHPREISAEWGAQRVKGLSITAILRDMFSKVFSGKKQRKKVETSLIEEFYYPKYGPGQLWEQTAKEVTALGGDIRTHCKVVAMHAGEDGSINAVEYQHEGETVRLECDALISSMPVKDLVAGLPEVPADIAAAAKGLPYRDFVTVGLLVDKLNLVNQTDMPTLGDMVPDCWIYVQDKDVKLGRIQIFNNWSPYMVADPERTVWIGLEYFCNEGDDFWNMEDKTCIDFAVGELVHMGILRSADEVQDAHRERVKKAYPAYFDTYDQMDSIVDYLSGIPNLYCVGRNGQHRYNNMDHSMATSFAAVENIIEGKTQKANIWRVNTEQEYHEEKS